MTCSPWLFEARGSGSWRARTGKSLLGQLWGPSGSFSCSAAQPVKRTHLLSYLWFVECLLGAAMSLETSSENPAAWSAVWEASCRRSVPLPVQGVNLAETTGLEGMGETEVVTHTAGSDAETTAETATRGDQNDLANLSGSKILNDLVQQGKQRKHVHWPSIAKVVLEHPLTVLWAPELKTWTGSRVLWTVVNMSTMARTHNSKIRVAQQCPVTVATGIGPLLDKVGLCPPFDEIEHYDSVVCSKHNLVALEHFDTEPKTPPGALGSWCGACGPNRTSYPVWESPIWAPHPGWMDP